MTENLFKKLYDYSQSGIYPFCMPGHKRNFVPEYALNPYLTDITEVEGFDDLQKCEGLLGDIQSDFSRIYGCRDVFISVNGTSACNIAAIAALPEDGRILCASNCHRSVFNAIALTGKKSVLIDPPSFDGGLSGGICPDEAESFFERCGDISALVVTSPTYEGFTSDIPALAKTAHRHNALLIVDEAHGAHLPFCGGRYFPESALRQGADIVTQSLHKTLPALNQTSLVFVPGDRSLALKVKNALNMVMTTSPSYILIASAQAAVTWAFENAAAFSEYEERIRNLRSSLKGLRKIQLVDNSVTGNYNIRGLDPGKLVFLTHPEKTGMTGRGLTEILLGKYSLQLEKYENGFALAMTSAADTYEALSRLEKALFETDSLL